MAVRPVLTTFSGTVPTTSDPANFPTNADQMLAFINEVPAEVNEFGEWLETTGLTSQVGEVAGQVGVVTAAQLVTAIDAEADANILRDDGKAKLDALVQFDTEAAFSAASPAEIQAKAGGKTTGVVSVDILENGSSYSVDLAQTAASQFTTAGGVKASRVSHDLQLSRVGRPANVTAALGGAGVLNGACTYQATFVTADGETEASLPSAGISPANQQVTLTLPVSGDPRVTARKIYRTPVGAVDTVLGKLVTTINDNTTTTYTDNTADGSLGANAPHFDTTGGEIFDGTTSVGNIGGLATKIGFGAHPKSAGYANTAFGAFALRDNDGGTRNVGIGTDALRFNTTGRNNNGTGVHALDMNTTGSDNNAYGLNALFLMDGGDGNSAFGGNAAASMTSGSQNVIVGNTAAQLKTTGTSNTIVGAQAAFGAGDLGIQNSVFGSRAFEGSNGSNFNALFGYNAGGDLTTGGVNTAVGWNALSGCTTGAGNIAIGPRAGAHENSNGKLWVDSFNRADLATAQVTSLIYGEMGLNRTAQQISFNGQVNPLAGLGMPGRTATADTTVAVDDTVINCNKASSMTVTLPTGKPDKVVIFRNKTGNAVTSATANVEPITGAANSNAILPGTAGSWVMLRCQANGSTWEIVMQG